MDNYAKRHGHDTTTALNQLLAEYFAWKRQDFEEAVVEMEAGYEDMQAGRLQDAKSTLMELRLKHDPSR